MILPSVHKGGYRQFKFKKYNNSYHCGRDRNCNEGDPVYSVKNGKVIFSGNVNGFGSFGFAGGVVMVESDDNNHTILYGHIIPQIQKDDVVTKGTLIGRIIKYEYKYKGEIIRADHLHWGDWIPGGKPTTNYGYVELDELKNWVDPNINI